MEELHHSARNFGWVVGDYLGAEEPLIRYISMWPRHMKHFKCQYNNVFVVNSLFVADILKYIHNWLQVLLHLCSTMCLYDA